MRSMVNLLIVILIAYTMNAVPVNTKLLSFDVIKPWDKISEEEQITEPIVNDFPTLEYKALEESEFINPEIITVDLVASRSLSKDELTLLENSTNVSIENGNDSSTQSLVSYKPANLNAIEAVEELPAGQWLYRLNLELSSKSTGYFIGIYPVNIEMTQEAWQLDETIEITASYMPEFTYKAAIPSVNKNEIYTQVYYLNASKEFLVPITKKLGSSSKFIRNTINAISYEMPDNSTIFAQELAFPKLPRVYLNSGVLSCYLNSSQLGTFEEGSDENKLIVKALVKSLTDIGYVDHLKFFVDNKQQGNFINGQPLKSIYNEDFAVYAYLNYYDQNGSSYLVPQAIEDGEDTVEDLFNILKTTYKPVDKEGLLVATVPNSIQLINKEENGTELKLTFSDALYTSFSDQPSFQNMMMDSMVQSFTSLPSVEKVVIVTENHATGTIGNTPLGKALSANRFLNPVTQ